MDTFYLILLTSLAFTIASIAGFGSNIIGLSLGLTLYPLTFLMPVLLPLNVGINLLIVIKNRKYINSTILKSIFPLFPAGSALGLFIFHTSAMDRWVIILFAFFILYVAMRDIHRQYREDYILPPEKTRIDRSILEKIYMTSSGIIHGIYATGGPLLVIAVSRLNQGKDAMRSTLPLIWVIMNSILTTTYAAAGLFNPSTIKTTLILTPFALSGFFIGEQIYKKIDEERFKTIVSLILISGAVVIIIKNLN